MKDASLDDSQKVGQLDSEPDASLIPAFVSAQLHSWQPIGLMG